ncbi:zeta toxin family protein [Streptomyces sp. NBC_01546]|uniref:zeta toxin family protein n=1 Tax=Streptomyces sp. NBC_01546 TaxID=2975872 RepID=UPI002F912755
MTAADEFSAELTDEQIQHIFDRKIVPRHLSPIVPQDHPEAELVIAPPGSGKTTYVEGRCEEEANGARPKTQICSDKYKGYNETYRRLLIEQPRDAGRLTRSFSNRIHTMAEAYVRERRGDILDEIAPSRVEDFVTTARRLHEAEYWVIARVLAVRRADSLQGVALRYARLRELGAPARFTTREGHDLCYQVLTDIADVVEEIPWIDSVIVQSRSGEVLYENTRNHAGSWIRPPGCAVALNDERNRPYLPAESEDFRHRQAYLREALKDHPSEIADIARLAAPLLPRWPR